MNASKENINKIKEEDEIIPFYGSNIFSKMQLFHKKNKIGIFLFVINIFSIILYFISLRSCEKDPSECTIKHGLTFYIIIGILALISAFLYSIFISLSLYLLKYFFHYLYTIPIFLLFFIIFKGTDTVNHGFYNMIGFLFFNIIFIPSLLFAYKLYKCFKEKNYKIIIFITILIMIFIIYCNSYLTIFSCKGWDKGLNKTKIDNNKTKYPCKIKYPKKNNCYISAMDGVFDMSKIFRKSCTSSKILEKERDLLLKSLSNEYFGVSKLNHFGYPITVGSEKYSMYSCEDLKDYMNIVNKGIIKMDLYNENNYPGIPSPEVELFFDDKNYGKIKINVIKNETLSKERKKISERKNSLYNNVLMIYLDAISRNHFQRKIKKLSKFIEPFMKYNLNETEKKFTAFQFMKYQTLKTLTIPNIKAMFYGIHLKEGDGINLVKFYKNQGYITGHTGTTYGNEIFSVNALLKSQKLDYDSWDHENIAMFCDANFFAHEYPLNKGIGSVLKRCLYGKYAFEYMIEYAKQFWTLYKDDKKFFRIHFNEGHEGTLE